MLMKGRLINNNSIQNQQHLVSTTKKRKNNMKKLLFHLCIMATMVSPMVAQEVLLEGYAFESGNRGYLNEVKVQIKDNKTNQVIGEISSDKEGKFVIALPKGDYVLEAKKDLFHPKRIPVSLKKDKEYIKLQMERKPGYIFDVTMAEKRLKGKEQVDAIEGARIEVYNNTTQEPEVELENHPAPTFKVNFERGNHYTIMIRKEGYFTKRLEAYVDVKGCILCFDGVGNVQPGVSDVLTGQNQMGTLLANIELQPILINEAFELKNIYYDLNSSKLRPEAEKELESLITLIKDNPGISIEIGSHTDARGKDDYNLKLSQRRAQAVVDYLTDNGNMDPSYLAAKGYGEKQPVNGCKNGVKCSERRHQENRRTELKVVGIEEAHSFANQRLAEIIQFENLSDEIIEVGMDGQIKVPEGGPIPESILKDIQKANQPKRTPTASVEDVSTPANNRTTNQNPIGTPTVQPTVPTKQKATTPPAQQSSSIPTSNTGENAGETLVSSPPSKASPTTSKPSPSRTNTTTQSDKIVPTKSGETIVKSSSKKGKTTKIPAGFTGYYIEFMVTNAALPMTHEVFSRHGNIAVEQKANGEHAYLLGNFKEKKDAAIFLREVMLPRYPTARLVYYLNGKRIGYTKFITPKKGNQPR